jgi:hypothetical protein
MSDEQTKPREFKFEIFETPTGVHCDMITNHPAGNYHTVEYRALTALQKENEHKSMKIDWLLNDSKKLLEEIKSLREQVAIAREDIYKIAAHDTLDGDKYLTYEQGWHGVADFAKRTLAKLQSKGDV